MHTPYHYNEDIESQFRPLDRVFPILHLDIEANVMSVQWTISW